MTRSSLVPDRADYLARTILTRARRLNAEHIKDEPYGHGPNMSRLQEEVVAKILAVETGVVDGVIVSRIANAIPPVGSARPVSDKQHDELAAFLRRLLQL